MYFPFNHHEVKFYSLLYKKQPKKRKKKFYFNHRIFENSLQFLIESLSNDKSFIFQQVICSFLWNSSYSRISVTQLSSLCHIQLLVFQFIFPWNIMCEGFLKYRLKHSQTIKESLKVIIHFLLETQKKKHLIQARQNFWSHIEKVTQVENGCIE